MEHPTGQTQTKQAIYTGCEGVRAIVAKQFGIPDTDCDEFLKKLYAVTPETLAQFKSRLWRHPELRYILN